MDLKILLLSMITFMSATGCSMEKSLRHNTLSLPVEQPVLEVSERTQRNLRMPWRQRQYFAVSKQYAKAIKPRSVLVTERPIFKQAIVPAITQIHINHSNLHSVRSQAIHHPVTFTLSEFAPPASTAPGPGMSKIPFAIHRETLGPKGRKHTAAVIDEAKAASRVILQGIANTPGYAPDSLDRIAIGRSLSIRKFLMERGIPKDKFTILERQNEHFHPLRSDGNYVEIRFET